MRLFNLSKKKIDFTIKNKVTKQQAVMLGEKHYFGDKCDRGHEGWRYINGSCIVCAYAQVNRFRDGITLEDIETKKKIDDILFEREVNKITNDEC